MIRRITIIGAALSLGIASIASAAAPVRAGSAPVAARPLTSIVAGTRVGAAQPEDSNELFGSIIVTGIIILLLIGGTAAIIIGGSSSTPR